MRVARGAEQQEGGAERAAGDDDDVGGIVLGLLVAQDVDAADASAGRVGLEAGDVGAGQEGEVGMLGAGPGRRR